MSTNPSSSRRDLLKQLGAGASLIALSGAARADDATTRASASDRGDDFSFVHLTDAHVTPRRGGDVGYRMCVAHVNALPDKPAFVMMGGDGPFDGLYTERADFERDTELFRSISAELTMPVHHAIGNHDVLGLSSRRKVPVDDPELGKAFIMKRLGMERSYYSFDHGNWHFAVLDSIFPIATSEGPGYEARIGEEQLHWLAHDLGQAGDRPKVVLSHIAAFFSNSLSGDPEAKAITPGMVLKDTKDLRLVLERHKVKALLQGHSHKIEGFDYRGVKYLTSPAVSSAWWAGTWLGTPPAYTQFYCRGDELRWAYREFGWACKRDAVDEKEEKLQADYDAAEAEQARLAAAERA